MNRADLEHILRACLELHDLAISKLAAGREKDLNYVTALLKHKMARIDKIEKLIESVKDKKLMELISNALRNCAREE